MKRISWTLFFALLAVLILPLSAQADCSSPAGEEGTQMYNGSYKVMQFCDGTTWWSMRRGDGGGGGGDDPSCNAADPNLLSIGTTCTDGSIFLGSHPVLSWQEWYVTNTDQGTNINWSTETVDTGADSETNGYKNQQWIINNKTLSDYPAFETCENLNRHGHTDWYLPSKDELDILYENRGSIGGFTTNSYFSSTEGSTINAWSQDFSDGTQGNWWKNWFAGRPDVRCVRRE